MTDSKYSIKAFTMMELTVAMVISALVISITYAAYGIVAGSFKDFKAKNEKMDTLMLIDRLIKRDFEKAAFIKLSHNSILFQKDNDTADYTILPNALIRKDGLTDTFKVSITSSGVFYNGQPVVISGDDDTTAAKLIDELQLIISCPKDSITYKYHKEYSSVDLFNQK